VRTQVPVIDRRQIRAIIGFSYYEGVPPLGKIFLITKGHMKNPVRYIGLATLVMITMTTTGCGKKPSTQSTSTEGVSVKHKNYTTYEECRRGILYYVTTAQAGIYQSEPVSVSVIRADNAAGQPITCT
jgi:hypothetical protein